MLEARVLKLKPQHPSPIERKQQLLENPPTMTTNQNSLKLKSRLVFTLSMNVRGEVMFGLVACIILLDPFPMIQISHGR